MKESDNYQPTVDILWVNDFILQVATIRASLS
jgi:hypothetical protein